MSNQPGLSVAEIFANTAIPKVTESSGPFGKTYVRLGPLVSTVGSWMFQSGGTLGYALKHHPVMLGKLLGIPSDSAYNYVNGALRDLATDLLAKVSGNDNTLFDIFLYPLIAQSGYDLSPGAGWINKKVYTHDIWQFAQASFQKGVAIGFHHPDKFEIFWFNTHKLQSQNEWDEAYNHGIVTTPKQEVLVLEDEAFNSLGMALLWLQKRAPTQLTSNELAIISELSSSSGGRR
jgi:hypothetical protein